MNADVAVTRKDIRTTIFRYLCLLTAAANTGGNVILLLWYRPILTLFHVAPPRDLCNFTFVSGFSFTIGILAFFVFLQPERNVGLLVVGIIGKGIYSFFTAYFYDQKELVLFYRLFGIWDGAFVVVFFLFLIHIVSKDITSLNTGQILPGSARQTKRALLIYYSLTQNGTQAMARVRAGLQQKGYTVDEELVQPTESLFHFPFSLGEFVRIMLRAIFRRPATIKPLTIDPTRDYDLVVIESQTWFVGMSAPVEAIFSDPAARKLLAGRDAATVNVCRKLWRRPQAMLIRRLGECGATVVGARAYANPGREPLRTLSLFIFLAAGAEGRPRFLRRWLTPQHLDARALADAEQFGEMLAERNAPAWPAPLRVGAALTTPGVAT